MQEMLRDLARLRHYAMGLQQLMDDLRRAAPERSEGSDGSAAIRAVLGRNGMPEEFRVSTWWREQLPAGSFATAVTEACEVAAENRRADWARELDTSGWRRRLDVLEADSAAAAEADNSPPSLPSGRTGDGTDPRPPGALAEELMTLLDTVTHQAATSQPQSVGGSGTNKHDTLTITLSPEGKTSCRANSSWVSQRSGTQLTEALNAVLATARRNFAASGASSAADDPGDFEAHQRQLMTEIFASLNDAARRQ